MRNMHNVHIGYTQGNPNIPFRAMLGQMIKTRATQHGVVLSSVPAFEVAEQIAVIDQFVQQGVDVLLIGPVNSYGIVPAVEQANAAGIPVVVVDMALQGGQVACTVSTDNFRGANLSAAYLVDRLKGQGKVMHLHGPFTQKTSVLRAQGFHHVADHYPDMQLVLEANGEWTWEQGANLTRQILATHPDLRGIFAANDQMALGALTMLEEAGRLDQVVVVGFDAEPDALLAVHRGRLAATVRQSANTMGQIAVDKAIQVVRGEPVPALVLTETSLVTADTAMSATLELLGMLPPVLNELTESGVALLGERNLLRTLIDTLPDYIYVKDRESRFMSNNLAVTRLMGAKTPDELTGKTDFDYYPVELATKYHADEQMVLQSGQALLEREEIVIDQATGEQRWILTTKAPFQDSQGRIKGIVGIGRDITRRKQMEQALQNARDELEVRVEQRTAELKKANEQLAALYNVGQIIRTSLQLDVVLEVIAQSTAHLLETDTGVILLLDETGTSLTIKGAYGLGEHVVRETRDRVGESIAGRVVQTGQPIIANDLLNDPRFYNPAAAAEGLLACASVPLVVGEKIIGTLDVHSKTNRYAFDEGYIQILNMLAGQAAIAIENARLYAELQQAHDKLEERVQQRTAELVTANTQLQQEISERKRLEEQLRQSQKMEAIGRLAGGIAHDFNNLLTAILGYSNLLLANLTEDSPLRQDIGGIKRAGERAAALTRQLLAFSRQQVLQPELLNLNAVVTNMSHMLCRLIDEDINLVTHLETDLGWVKADPNQIEQVIINMVVNARDAMPQGGKLILETANVELDETYARFHVGVTPGPYVLLAITDTGQGIDADMQARIFDPFFTTKEQGKGTGLGLAMVHGIVNQSGGHIWVYSELEQGTTFKIYLPQAEPPAEPATPRPALAKPRPGSETILLVEDGDMVRDLAQQILQGEGYMVLAASNGVHAYQIATEQTGPIHLLLTDVVMPGGMSGPDLAKVLTYLQPSIKVLYMSGYTENAIVHHGVLDEGIAFLPKPFVPDDLIRAVRRVLDAEEGQRTD